MADLAMFGQMKRVRMRDMKHNRKKGILLAGGIFLICAAVGLILLLWFEHRAHSVPSDHVRDEDISALSRGDFETVLLSMYTPEKFSEGEFEHFRGCSVVQAFHPFVNLADIGDYLEKSFSNSSNLSSVYIGLDPFVVSGLYGYHASFYIKDYKRYLTDYVEAHEDVTFELLLPAYSLDYLRSLSDRKYEELVTSYRNLVNLYIPYDNVFIYFMGYEEWLIVNPGNYDTDTELTPSILHLIAAYSMRDNRYVLTPDNMEERFAQMTELVRESDVSYPDLSEWCMVFFGDSVFEYYADSRSVSGVVENLSGARVYNCSLGGTAAAENPEKMLSFNRMTARFIGQNTSGLDEDLNFSRELTKYIQDDPAGKKYCFVLNYGLNDYFSGYPVENPADRFDAGTYAGALRTGIRTLQEAYPEAVILLLTPTYTSKFSGGTEMLGASGGVLTDYVEAAIEVAQDMDVVCVNNYTDSGIKAGTTGKYLADEIHPNETGTLLLGRHILEVMQGIVGDGTGSER